MKIRIKFRKWGAMKFVGHLDMMRYFQKAIRRAEIDICYSEGFSPHQIMSFAAPLGVGLTSDGEYFDIEVNATDTTEASLERLNRNMVDGVEVTGYVRLSDNAKTAMSIVAAADYRVSFREGAAVCTAEEFREKIRKHFLDAEQFIVTKKTKKSERELDLKPLVYDIAVEEEEGRPQFYLLLSTGSSNNIKPEFVLSSIFDAAGIPYDPAAMQIHKIETYAMDEAANERVPLLALGETIV